nr:tyrosine-type recombinase/integrase [Brevibacterium luteolum]
MGQRWPIYRCELSTELGAIQNNSVRTRNDILTDNQVDRLLRTAYGDPGARSNGLADFLSLNAAIGLRLGEAVSIRWQDLDLDAEVPTLSIVGKLGRVKEHGLQWEDFVKSDLSARTIPLPADTADMLRDRSRAVAERKLSGEATEAETKFVFPCSARSTPDPDNANKRVRKIFDAAELPTTTNHTLRRTVEDRLNRSGVSPIDIERVMGHTQAVAHASYWNRSSVPTGALNGLEGYSAPKTEAVTELRGKRDGDLRAANS